MKFLILSVFVFFISCSSGEKEEQEEMMGEDIASEEADMLLDDSEMSESEEFAGMEQNQDDDMSMDDSGEEQVQDGMSEDVSMVDEGTGTEKTYEAKRGDTLMLMAFNIYGDYAKWRRFINLNPELQNDQTLRAGQVIKYNPPATPFVWRPEGQPHLIKRGETLGTISMDKYQTNQRWRDIFNNNRPMIKNPNLIFSGFTLYYIPDNNMAFEGAASRQSASQDRKDSPEENDDF